MMNGGAGTIMAFCNTRQRLGSTPNAARKSGVFIDKEQGWGVSG